MTFNKGHLKVSNIHKIYYEEFGHPNGIPILFLHGGPGAGFSSFHRKLFNVKTHRVIFFDQRGAGKSLPLAELRDNNTNELIKDIEKLRKYLEIDKWFIFGGSWGSTLAILYGIENPNRCLGFILRGIFLGTTALSLLGQKLVGPKKEDESEEEYLQRRKTAVSNYLRRYYSNLNPTASSTDVEAFVQRNTVDYKAEGGRIGFDKGGIMDVPVRTNSEGVKELDYRKTGGFVPIGVKEKADDVPAMLSLNEFVMTADAVRGAGDGSIEKGAQRMYDTMKKLENRVG